MRVEQEVLFACFQVFHPHVLGPLARDFVEGLTIGTMSLYFADDGVICAIDESLDFEFDVADEASLLTPNPAVVAEFKLHSAKKNTSDQVSNSSHICQNTNLAYILGWVMRYSSLSRLRKVRTALPSIIVPALERVSIYMHKTRWQPVAKEFRSWLQETVDADVVFGIHVEVGGHRRMVTNLLCQVERLGTVLKLPFTGEVLPKNRIKGLLHTLAAVRGRSWNGHHTGGRIWNPER